jgi:hypothetical protein
MDVRLSLMLPLGIFVALMAVGDGRVVVLVVVGGDEMSHLFFRPVVVSHVDVLMGVDHGIVIVSLFHVSALLCSQSCLECREPSLSPLARTDEAVRLMTVGVGAQNSIAHPLASSPKMVGSSC